MKKLIILGFGLSFALASVLSDTKEKNFKTQEDKIKKDTVVLEKSWLSPATLSLGVTHNKSVNDINSIKANAQVSWSQDLFRSGGIKYAIEYAKNIGIYNLSTLKQSKLSLIKQAFTLKAEIIRDELSLKQAYLQLKNREIDLKIIKDKYIAGSSDISTLNRALLDRDSQENTILTLKNSIQTKKFELKKISNKDFEVPNIELISKEEYLKNHIDIKVLKDKSESDYFYEKYLNASYLPKLTFSTSAGYVNNDSDKDTSDYDGFEYSLGLTFSMPLDYNRKANLESCKLNYIKSKLDIKDKKEALIQNYDEVVANINSYKSKIEVSNRIKNSYEELLSSTQAQFSAGLKTNLDVESLSNSLEIQKLEIAIQRKNIVIEKIALYFDIKEK
jgi:outer membrane protein TolC